MTRKSPLEVRETRIETLQVANQRRIKLGDVGRLADSIQAIGLIQPITITPNGRVVDGERRIHAVRLLGMTSIPAVTVDSLGAAVARLKLGREENVERLPMRPQEWVAVGMLLEDIDAPAMFARKRANLRNARIDGAVPDPYLEGRRDTVDFLCEGIGVSRQTYRRAKAVVLAATDTTRSLEDRAIARRALAEMNITGRVNPAYQKVRKERPVTNGSEPDVPLGTVAQQRKQYDNVIRELKGMAYALTTIGATNPDVPASEAAQWVDGLAGVRRTIEQAINRLRDHTREHA